MHGQTTLEYSFVICYMPSVKRMLYIFELINVISAGSCKQRWTLGLYQRRRITSVPDRPSVSAKGAWLLELTGKFMSLLYYTLPQKGYSFDKRGALLSVLSYHSSDTPYWHQGKEAGGGSK